MAVLILSPARFLNSCTLNGNDIYASSDTDANGQRYASAYVASCLLKDSPLINGGFGDIRSSGNNLSSDNGNGFLTFSDDQINIDPLLDPLGLQDNGGPTQTIALTYGSPAIRQRNKLQFRGRRSARCPGLR